MGRYEDVTRNPDIERFLSEHPDVGAVDLLLPDMNGVLRGKRTLVGDLDKLYRDGVCLPGSVYATDITGKTVEETGLGLDEGDADRICRPLDGTLGLAPWHQEPMGQVLLSMHEEDGAPFFAEPRHVLRRVVDRFTELALTPVVAVEMEFYLLDRQRGPGGTPQPPISPVTGERSRATQVYGIAELDDHGALLGEICRFAGEQGIPAQCAVAEYAPGQFEINLHHVSDPVQACDHAVLLKRLIKGSAARHGFDATFMAKPYAQHNGSGTHMHVSLVNEQGTNIFAEQDGADSPALLHGLGGLLATMREAMALFAPHANSYRRLRPGTYAPVTPAWGVNNRTTALRIPAGPRDARRIEHRAAGADANPYLVLAAILAGIHHGISGELNLGEATTGNAYDQYESSLPASWDESLRAFERGENIRTYLGQEFSSVYAACKLAECEEFQREISPLEYEWYLRQV